MRVDKIFDEYGVAYYTAGSPNTSPGWISLRCPFCRDRSNHLGVNLKSGKFYCWKCKGHKATDCLMEILGVDYHKARKLLDKHQVRGREEKVVEVVKTSKPLTYPSDCKKQLLRGHKEYLASRGFDPDKIAREWDIWGTGKNGYLGEGHMNYRKRLIFPIYWEGDIVSWQSRDVTGQAVLRYKACPSVYEKIPHQHIVYSNKDYDGEMGICCEGVIDCLKVGKYAFATFGTGVTKQQVRSIAKKYSKVFVLYDPEENAQKEARKLVRELNFRGLVARNVNIKDFTNASDPGDMSKEEVETFIREII